MANVGNLAVVLSLDAVAFATGLDSAGKSASGFASGLSATFAGLSAIEAAGGAAMGTVEGLYAGFKSGLEEIVESGRKARELGTSLDTLAAVNLLAGKNAERFDESLVRLNRSLEEASIGGGEAANKFRELGLDANALLQMSLDKRIGAIGDKLNSLGASDRAFAAFELFGREGASILADLEKGSAGVAAAMEKIKAHGGAGITEADVEKARETQQSLMEMENSFNRIKLTLISEFAPVVKSVADWIADIAGPQGGKLRDVFHGAAVQLVNGLDAAVDSLAQALVYVHRMEKGWERIAFLANLGTGIQKSPFGKVGAADALDDFEKEVAKQAKDAHAHLKSALDEIDKPTEGIKPPDLPVGGIDKLAGPVHDLTLKLHDQVAAFGMAGDAAERFKLAGQGATAAQLAGVDAALSQLTALRDLDESVGKGLNIWQQQEDKIKSLNVWTAKSADNLAGFAAEYAKLTREMSKKIDAEALKVFEETASPLDKFKASLDDLDHLMALHKINAQQYAAAVAKDFEGIAGMSEKVEHPGAMLEGSTQAYETILHDQDRGRAGDVQQRIEAAVNRLVQQQAAAEKTNQQIADAINRIFKKG